MPSDSDIGKALAEPFDASEIKFKPQSVKGNRALAIAYIDARLVQDRLDEVLGVDGWQDDYEVLQDGSVVCRLRVRVNGEWVLKTDVGSLSEQPGGGDRLKAAFSAALKRAAVKLGVGRYLYRLAGTWEEYDPVKKQFARVPQLPAWARPGPQTIVRQVAPATVKALPAAAPTGELQAQATAARTRFKQCGTLLSLAAVWEPLPPGVKALVVFDKDRRKAELQAADRPREPGEGEGGDQDETIPY